MRRSLVLATLLFSSVLSHADDVPGSDCTSRNDTITTTLCFEQVRNDRDVQLNAVYQRILLALKEGGRTDPHMATSRQRLVEAQRRWVDYRDKDCTARSSLSNTESDRVAEQTYCLMERTRQRLAELTEMVTLVHKGHDVSQPLFLRADQRVDGQPMHVWLQRYWAWARSFPSHRNPSGDSDGSLCAVRQNETMFFLTGSNKAAAVHRVCHVPRGKAVLIPLINVMAEVQERPLPCAAYVSAVNAANRTATDLQLSLDGRRVDEQAFLLDTGCFELSDAGLGLKGSTAGAGAWAVMKPLQPGSYRIRFAGRYGSDGFSQDVTYDLIID
jgi:uncharacterized protein YecT (DUF1311 family)